MATPSVAIPKIIYSLWLQGRDQLPPVARLNFKRWMALNPDYELRVLDRGDADALLRNTGVAVASLTPQALSDAVRACLLAEVGGIWVDASGFPIRPLNDWLTPMVNDVGFFGFEHPTPDRLISSWFLAASPRHVILREWWNETKRFWSKPRRLVPGDAPNPVASVSPQSGGATDQFPYFWFHYLFQYLVESRPEIAALWHRCPKMPAVSAHRLQYLFLNVQNPTAAAIRQAAYASPVQKLNWRAPYPLEFLAALPPLPETPSPTHTHAVLNILSTAGR